MPPDHHCARFSLAQAHAGAQEESKPLLILLWLMVEVELMLSRVRLLASKGVGIIGMYNLDSTQ